MSAEQKLYEFLIRRDPTGKIDAAHAIYWDEVIRNGVTSYEPGIAVPISTIDLASSGLISKVTQDALLQVAQLQAEVANVKGLNDVLNEGLNDAKAEIDAQAAEMIGLQDQITVKSAAAAQANAKAELLQADKAGLESQLDALRAENAEMKAQVQAANTEKQRLLAAMPEADEALAE